MLKEGTIVAGYRIDGVLGDGGMGVVYRATQLSLEREVALKLLSSDLGDDSGFRTRFQREGQLQAGLDHDHIVPVYEAGQAEQGLFLAMRLIDGPTLKDLIRSRELDPRRILRLLAQVARALDSAHAAGLIHRDIKPQNILIDRGDHAYLADFGLIKAPDEAARLTGTGQFIGTIDYVAPEQIQGDPASSASDCYALAGVFYECLTGEVPFPRPNEAATLHSHVIAPPPKVTDRRPDLPVEIDEVIARGMAKDPAARPQSASELIMAASRALASAPSGIVNVPVSERPGPGEIAAPRPSPGGDQSTRVRSRPVIESFASTPALERAHDSMIVPVPAEPPVAEAPVADPAVAEAPVVEPAVEEPALAASPRIAEPLVPVAPTGRRAAPALTLLLLVAAAAVAGFLVGHSGDRAALASYRNSVAVNHLQLRYPSTWQLGAASNVVTGMSFDSPLVLTRADGAQGLTAGTVADAGGATLLSTAFLADVQGGLPRAQPVALGAVQAYRYAGVHVTGLSQPVTVYVAPTTAGVATIACWSARGPDTAFQADCGRVASTLRLIGTSAYPLGPSPVFAQLLASTLAQLRSSTRSPLAALGSATSAPAQATAAQTLAGDYDTAAGTIDRAVVSPASSVQQTAIVTALRHCAGAYAAAAAAAANPTKGGAAAAFDSAGKALNAASTAMSQALRGLTPLGYNLTGQR